MISNFFMGRQPRRDPENLIEREFLLGSLGKSKMPHVDGIKGPAEKPDPHRRTWPRPNTTYL